MGHTKRCAEVDMRVLQWGKVLMGYLFRMYDTVCLSQPIAYTAQRSPSVSQTFTDEHIHALFAAEATITQMLKARKMLNRS